MRKVIIIGTLHLGSTPHKELEKILKRIRPNRLLVEIAQEDIENNAIENYPD